jgi:hypothetical protein
LNYGYLPVRTPSSLLFVLWFDFGLVGTAGFAVLLVLLFKAAGQMPANGASSILAGVVAILIIAILGIATSQIWWLTLVACDGIAFAVLIKAADKGKRPDVDAIRAIEAGSAQTFPADRAVVSGSSAAAP